MDETSVTSPQREESASEASVYPERNDEASFDSEQSGKDRPDNDSSSRRLGRASMYLAVIGIVMVGLAGILLAQATGIGNASPGVEVDRDAGTEQTSDASAVATEPVQEIDFTKIEPSDLASLLERIPDTPSSRDQIVLSDWARARELLGMEVPDPADSESVAAYFERLTSSSGRTEQQPTAIAAQPAGLSLAGLREATIASWKTEVGWTPLDLVRSATTPTGDDVLNVFQVAGDTDEIVQAIHTDPNWSDALRERSHAGHGYFAWDDAIGPADASQLSGPRPEGIGGHLAIIDDIVLRTIDDAVMQRALETTGGTPGSLADDESYLRMAEALDDAGAYTAAITGSPVHLTTETLIHNTGFSAEQLLTELDEWLERQTFLSPYTAAAVGAGVDDDGSFAVIILDHQEAVFAEQNVDLLRRIVNAGTSMSDTPWSDSFAIREITAQSSLTVAILSTDDPQRAIDAVRNMDSLLLSS